MTSIKTYVSKLSNYLPYKVGGFAKFMAFIQFFYLYQVAATNDVGGVSFSLGSIALMIWSMATVFWFFQMIGTWFSFSKRAFIISMFGALTVYDLIIAYQFGTKDLLRYSILIDNVSSAFSQEAFEVMTSTLDVGALQYIPVIILLFLFLEYRKKSISKGIQEKPLAKKGLIAAIIYVGIIFMPIDSYDPLINFWRSIKHYYAPTFTVSAELAPNTYPNLSAKNTLHYPVGSETRRPTIFLIMVESLNASAIGSSNPQGKPVTPYLNALREKSVYAPHFYGNSIQTAKGNFATLFGTIPSLSGKTYVKFPQTRINSIASELKKVGYDTHFFSAHKNKTFDNMGPFLAERGFDNYDIAAPYLTEDEKDNRWRWGAADPVFFKRAFDYVADQQKAHPNRPQFFTLATIANHFPFNSMPDDMKVMYPEPGQSLPKHYANSVHWSDRGIATFFEELEKRGLAENSLVIIIGDHAYPLGEHGNYHLEAGYHEESHRMPFFMVWKDVLAPRVLPKAYAQMDIAPTIFDLLNIPLRDHNFAGTSVFSEKPQHFLYLVQPYGKHLSIVDYPHKYRFHTKTQFEYVYNLEKDPMERKNIVQNIPDEQLERYRAAIKTMFINHQALAQDQVIK